VDDSAEELGNGEVGENGNDGVDAKPDEENDSGSYLLS